MNKRVGAALLALWMLLGAAPALGAAQRLEQTHQAGKVEVIFDAVVAPPLVENAQPLRVRYKQWTDQEIARFWLEEEAPPKGPDVDYTGPDGKSLLGLGGRGVHLRIPLDRHRVYPGHVQPERKRRPHPGPAGAF